MFVSHSLLALGAFCLTQSGDGSFCLNLGVTVHRSRVIGLIPKPLLVHKLSETILIFIRLLEAVALYSDDGMKRSGDICMFKVIHSEVSRQTLGLSVTICVFIGGFRKRSSETN